ELHRVALVGEVDELDALDHAATRDVEAGDQTDAAHASIPSSTLNRPSTNALPTIAPARRRPPASRRASRERSCVAPTPPEATSGSAVRPKSACRASTSGPPRVPSRSTSVTTTAPSVSADHSANRSTTDHPDPASHPWAWASATPSSLTR